MRTDTLATILRQPLPAREKPMSVAASGAVLTMKQLLDYVPERVAEFSREQQTPWVPHLEDFGLQRTRSSREAPSSHPALFGSRIEEFSPIRDLLALEGQIGSSGRP
jgi:hypothetical protein